MDADRQSKTIRFGIAHGRDIPTTEGTKRQRGPAICPFCDQPTPEAHLRRAGVDGTMGERMIAAVLETGGRKDYRAADEGDLRTFADSSHMPAEAPREWIVPEINGPNASPTSGPHRSISLELYGLKRWGQLFNRRQLAVITELIRCLHEAWDQAGVPARDAEYRSALATYLAFWVDRVVSFCNTMCRWFPGRESIIPPFSGQSIPMMWDYPEVNPFAASGSAASNQIETLLKVLRREAAPGESSIRPTVSLGSATHLALPAGLCDVVVTDPPYGDAIGYADLSDFFYVWLKRSLGPILPDAFGTPQTPKEQEATSHKHRHDGDRQRANHHYQSLLAAGFREAARVSRKPALVSVMFAHQTTEAWTALLSALFNAGLCPSATWPIATERPTGVLGLGTASLESSVTVVCRPRAAAGAGAYRAVRQEIHAAVEQAVHRFWSYGFRGADLIVASYGPAVGVFGKYERVERAEGTPVGVPELLEFARQAARDAIAGEFRGDSLSTLYFTWANLYGVADQAWDDARLVVQVGSDAQSAAEAARRLGLFVLDGARCHLALLADRAARRNLGMDPGAPLIDELHRAMLYWRDEDRPGLVRYLRERSLLDNEPFWKLAQALFEVIPHDTEDWKLVTALLGERETLRAERQSTSELGGLFEHVA
jgi:adenine-specific DNA methylase